VVVEETDAITRQLVFVVKRVYGFSSYVPDAEDGSLHRQSSTAIV